MAAAKTKFKIKADRFPDLIEKLSDLTDISESVKLKIDNENIMLYSTLGGGVLLAFKNYLVKTRDYLEWGDDLEYSIDAIILNAKKFVKNLGFIKGSEKITLEFQHKPSQDDDSVMVARSMHLVGGKLKVNWIAGEHYEMRDINKSILEDRLNLKNRKWNFLITKEEFEDVKKLANINGEKLLSISVTNGRVVISEAGAWEMELGPAEEGRNSNLILNKRFLKCIDDTKDVDFSIFENFMLIKDDTTNLMLSYEQNFSEEDE